MGAATTEGGRATAHRFYEFLGVGDLDGAITLLHDDLVVHEPAALPYGGEYHGIDGFRALAAGLAGAIDAAPTASPTFLDAGDHVAVLIPSRFTARDSGHSAEMDVVELVSFRDGLIAELNIFYRDPSAVAALVATGDGQ